jgi:hypothetical protein
MFGRPSIRTLLVQIKEYLMSTTNTGTSILASLSKLSDDFAKLKTDVTLAISTLQTQVTNLGAQLANGVPVTQTDLDAIAAKITELDSAINSEDAVVNPPAVAPTA